MALILASAIHIQVTSAIVLGLLPIQHQALRGYTATNKWDNMWTAPTNIGVLFFTRCGEEFLWSRGCLCLPPTHTRRTSASK